jgi:hypothetical protein
VDLSEIQAAYYMVAATGVLVAAAYYVITLRANQKTTKMTLETRQIQALLEYNQERTSIELPLYTQFMKAKWVSFDDFYEKYGAGSNPELFSFMTQLWNRYNISGLMIRDGLISVNAYVEYIGDAPAIVWDKYRDIILEYRRRFHLPCYQSGFEFIAGEINRYRIEKGWGAKTADIEPAVIS